MTDDPGVWISPVSVVPAVLFLGFFPPRSIIISKVVVTLLMLISFCVKYILFLFCFDFDSLSAHIHYINAMKLNFTILQCPCPPFNAHTDWHTLPACDTNRFATRLFLVKVERILSYPGRFSGSSDLWVKALQKGHKITYIEEKVALHFLCTCVQLCLDKWTLLWL